MFQILNKWNRNMCMVSLLYALNDALKGITDTHFSNVIYKKMSKIFHGNRLVPRHFHGYCRQIGKVSQDNASFKGRGE
jgi:hypothetical protein